MTIGRRPASFFYWGDWRRDPDLCRCSKGAKGVWIDMLAVAFECEQPGVFATNGVPWTIEEIAGVIGGDVAANVALIQELVVKGVARTNSSGAIYSRRMVQDEEAYLREKNGTRDRVRKHRELSNGHVTGDVTVKKRPCTEGEYESEVVVGFSLTNEKDLRDCVQRIFLFYCEKLKRNPQKYTLTGKREKKIYARVSERLEIHKGNLQVAEDEAKLAISNLAKSSWHIENGFIDLEDQIFRSAEEFEKRLNWEKHGQYQGNHRANGNGNGNRGRPGIEAVTGEASEKTHGNSWEDIPAGRLQEAVNIARRFVETLSKRRPVDDIRRELGQKLGTMNANALDDFVEYVKSKEIA